MSKGFDKTIAEAMLDAELGGAANMPNPIHMGLSTTDPGADGSGFTEPVGAGYARKSVANTLGPGGEWGPAGSAGGNPDAETSNVNSQLFVQATGAWGEVTHWGFFSAATGGAPLMWGELDIPRNIFTNDQLQFGASELAIKLQNQ